MGDCVSLDGAEAHHLIHVMRARPGARLILFDGRGGEWLAEIHRVERGRAELTILRHQAIERELPFVLTVAAPLPKGDRQRWLVEKAVELGVARLVPLRTSRSVVQPVEQAIARLARNVIEASKQCGRNRLMEIAEPVSWPDFVCQTQNIPARFVAHPLDQRDDSGANHPTDFRSSALSGSDGVVVAVGPEGGFTSEEVGLATDAGWIRVDLGPRILRVETAAIVMATMAIDRSLGPRPAA